MGPNISVPKDDTSSMQIEGFAKHVNIWPINEFTIAIDF